MQLRSLSKLMQAASFSWWHYNPLLCSVSNCEGWGLPTTGSFKLFNSSTVTGWISAFSEWKLYGDPLSVSDLWAIRAWIGETSDVTSHRLNLKCWCGRCARVTHPVWQKVPYRDSLRLHPQEYTGKLELTAYESWLMCWQEAVWRR